MLVYNKMGASIAIFMKFLGRWNVAVLLQLAAFAAQSGFALSPWVTTLFSCLHSLTALQVCSALTNVAVFSIGSFVNAVCFLAIISLWNQFSSYTLLVVVLIPCSLSYMACLFVHVHKKWTGNFQDAIQVVQLYSNLVFTFHTIIVGLYFLSAFFPTVLRNAFQIHRNHFTTLRTLNIVLISFCVSVPVLLGNEADEPEKPEAVQMAPAKILFRLVCVIAASVLSEAALGDDNIPQQLLNQVLPRNEFDNVPVPEHNQDTNEDTSGDIQVNNVPTPVTGSLDPEIENAPPPATESYNPEIENVPPPATDSYDPEIENVPPPATDSYNSEIENVPFSVNGLHHILSREECLEENQLVTNKSVLFLFLNQNPSDDTPSTPQMADDISPTPTMADDTPSTPQIADNIAQMVDDTPATPQMVDNIAQMVDDTPWLIVACQVQEVGGTTEFVV